MKRALIAFVLVLILISIVSAQSSPTSPSDNAVSEIDKAKTGLDIAGATAKNVSGSIDKGLNNLADAQITIPPRMQELTRFVFGLEGTITFSRLIVLLAIWVMILLVIVQCLKFVPMFKGNLIWPAGIVITILISLTGSIKNTYLTIESFLTGFKFLEGHSGIKFILVLLIAGIFFFGIIKILRIFYDKGQIKKAGREGEEAGEGYSYLKIAANAFKILGKSKK